MTVPLCTSKWPARTEVYLKLSSPPPKKMESEVDEFYYGDGSTRI